MSTGSENQAKLYAAYARIAHQLGYEYQTYPFDLLSPIDDSKKGPLLQASFAADPNFSAPLKYNKPVWICYADATNLNQFDFLVGQYGTYYVGDKQPMQPLQAIRTNHIVTLARSIYSTTGQIVDTVVTYAENLPVFMQYNREDIQKPAGNFGSQIGRAITHWTTFIPCPIGTIKQDDLMTDEDGISYIIDAPDFTNMGYVCHVRLATI